jgi:hypothetical protein
MAEEPEPTATNMPQEGTLETQMTSLGLLLLDLFVF